MRPSCKHSVVDVSLLIEALLMMTTCIQGLTFAPNTGKPSPGNVATVITNLIDTGAISLPLFTVALTSVPSSTAITAALIPGGRITFGALDSAEIGKDLAW